MSPLHGLHQAYRDVFAPSPKTLEALLANLASQDGRSLTNTLQQRPCIDDRCPCDWRKG